MIARALARARTADTVVDRAQYLPARARRKPRTTHLAQCRRLTGHDGRRRARHDVFFVPVFGTVRLARKPSCERSRRRSMIPAKLTISAIGDTTTGHSPGTVHPGYRVRTREGGGRNSPLPTSLRPSIGSTNCWRAISTSLLSGKRFAVQTTVYIAPKRTGLASG